MTIPKRIPKLRCMDRLSFMRKDCRCTVAVDGMTHGGTAPFWPGGLVGERTARTSLVRCRNGTCPRPGQAPFERCANPGSDALGEHLEHRLGEPVDLVEGGVDVGGDPEPGELGVADAGGD